MQTNSVPGNVIAAVTHRDPYPYYAELVANRPFYRDEDLGLWVASSADAVATALTTELCGVRPTAEPVPTALLGSPAAEIFRRLIRMNDGAGHCPFKRAITATLGSVQPTQLTAVATRSAQVLRRELQLRTANAAVTEFTFQLSVQTIGGLLGLATDQLQQAGQWVGEFVRCLFLGTPEQVEQGKAAAEKLFKLFRATLQECRPGLLTTLATQAELLGRLDQDVVIANGIGFLTQAYEATAGLIGNSLLQLGRNSELYRQIDANPALTTQLVEEVLRYDPPTHNTRRFVLADGKLLGRDVKAGETILVVLAAANRDPSLNAQPDSFQLQRQNPRHFTFSAGIHTCPGNRFALAIAAVGVAQLLAHGVRTESLQETLMYRASANTRIPLFN
jgi:cytochrome P450